MSNDELLAIGAGLGLGFLVVWFLLGNKKTAAAPAPSGMVDAQVLRERRESPDAANWPSVLGVAADATPEQIDAAYRRLSEQYDPTRLAGMAPELRQLAQDRWVALQDAYARARAQRPSS